MGISLFLDFLGTCRTETVHYLHAPRAETKSPLEGFVLVVVAGVLCKTLTSDRGALHNCSFLFLT